MDNTIFNLIYLKIVTQVPYTLFPKLLQNGMLKAIEHSSYSLRTYVYSVFTLKTNRELILSQYDVIGVFV